MSWDGKNIAPQKGILLFFRIIKYVGYWPAYALLIPVCFVFTLTQKNPRRALKQFRQHLGLKTSFVSYYCHFLSFGLSMIHRVGFVAQTKSGLQYHVENEDKIQEELAAGNGVILLSAHMGNWEIGHEVLMRHLHTPVNIVAVDRNKESAQKNTPNTKKVTFISPDDDALTTSLAIHSALVRGEIVAAMGDRSINNNVAAVSFLGERAHFPRGIFEIAALTRAKIFPVFLIRTGLHQYHFKATPEAITLQYTNRQERRNAINTTIQSFADLVAIQAKKTPYQWYNFYPFWDA